MGPSRYFFLPRRIFSQPLKGDAAAHIGNIAVQARRLPRTGLLLANVSSLHFVLHVRVVYILL